MDREQSFEEWAKIADIRLERFNADHPHWAGQYVSFAAQGAKRAWDVAYTAGYNAAIERAKEVVAPKGRRPCDCDRCTCGNQSDAEACAAWDREKWSEIAIDALKEQP